MSELLKAAVAARAVGLVVLECPGCNGAGQTTGLSDYEDATCAVCLGDWCNRCAITGAFCECGLTDRHADETCPDIGTGPCAACHATGINPDPARLGWVALMWLQQKGAVGMLRRDDDWHTPPFKVDFAWLTSVGAPCRVTVTESHDGTEPGIVTALLRLVARVGGKT